MAGAQRPRRSPCRSRKLPHDRTRRARQCDGQEVQAAGTLLVCFPGGGTFFWWQLGAATALLELYDLSGVLLPGLSAGSLAAGSAAPGRRGDSVLAASDHRRFCRRHSAATTATEHDTAPTTYRRNRCHHGWRQRTWVRSPACWGEGSTRTLLLLLAFDRPRPPRSRLDLVIAGAALCLSPRSPPQLRSLSLSPPAPVPTGLPRMPES